MNICLIFDNYPNEINAIVFIFNNAGLSRSDPPEPWIRIRAFTILDPGSIIYILTKLANDPSNSV